MPDSVDRQHYRRQQHLSRTLPSRGLEGKPGYLVVCSSLLEDQTLLRSFTSTLIMIPILLVVSGLGGYSLSRRALRPVTFSSLRHRASRRRSSRRIPVPQAKDNCSGSPSHRTSCSPGSSWLCAGSRSSPQMRPTGFVTPLHTSAQRQNSTYRCRLGRDSRDGFLEIAAETRSRTELLENLLLLARADAGHSPPEVSDVDARAQLRDVCERLEPLAKAKNQILVRGFATASYPLILSIDPSHLRRLV